MLSLIGEPLLPSKYWLGIQCSPVPPALRSHLSLPEKQGVLVAAVVKDSPAAKAGLAQYDVLLRAGGKPLAEPRDLLAAIDAAKETKLKIDLIRGGKPKTIEVTPAKRPEQIGGPALADQADWNTVEKWLEGMKSGEESGLLPLQFHFARPGMILPKDVLDSQAALPGNMSVVDHQARRSAGEDRRQTRRSKMGDNGERTRQAAGRRSAARRADARPQRVRCCRRAARIGHDSAGPDASLDDARPDASAVGTFSAPAPPPGMMLPQPFPGGLDPRLEKRFDEIDRRMDKLFKMMEKMSQQPRLGGGTSPVQSNKRRNEEPNPFSRSV